ncbi:Response regulator receiver domain-containing protein [Bradyrhizobium lablabi]|nr:Response regulator receiver domain-containing protein [Bradyrhizobium lablabi]SHL68317.1 Response regulator receiver domain-containing protein [Bradyrhizobium lablabi]
MAAESPVILIVEDEFLLRMDSAETLENAEFEVVQAGNADEAMAILQARPAIHVVFTDIQMPGSMDGLKLARFVPGQVASNQDRSDVRSCEGWSRRFAGRERLPAETVSRRPGRRNAAGDDPRCLINPVLPDRHLENFPPPP